MLVDLRNHGRSTEVEGINPPHDLVNAAKDLADLVKARGWNWPDVVIGHSLGGKVALQFMESCARGDYGQSASPPKQVFAFKDDHFLEFLMRFTLDVKVLPLFVW